MVEELISIIVPVYNVEKYLEKCIESIINQTYRNIEIILVDDGSKDNSGNICDKYAEKDSRIKVIHKKNGGLSDARNSGLEVAKGKYVGFVDSDDFIAKDMYEYLFKLMKNNDACISVCNYEKKWENISKKNEEKNFVKDYDIVLNSSEALKYIVDDKILKSYAWNKLYKIELFQDVRYPLGLNMEDIATTYKLIYNSKKIVIGNEIKYYYVQRKGSILNSKKSKYYIDYFKVFYERFLFLRNKGIKYEYLYISMINFILSLYLIKNEKVDEFRKENNIKNILKSILKQSNSEKINIDLKLIIRCKVLFMNERVYRYVFRRYIKWKTKLDPQELL